MAVDSQLVGDLWLQKYLKQQQTQAVKGWVPFPPTKD